MTGTLRAGERETATSLPALFQAKCVRCHGAKVQKGGLDLRTFESILRGGESGPVIEAGQPEESLLFEAIQEGRMPPPKEKQPLSTEEVESIGRWIAGLSANAVPTVAEARESYQEVMAILRLRCVVCHGPRKQEGSLSLTRRADILKGGKSGPAIQTGHSSASLMIQKVRSGAMPPRDKILSVGISPITDAELARVARWIDQGAVEEPLVEDVATTAPDHLVTDEDRQFWAFRPPSRPPVPLVNHRERIRNPIDAFLLARLEPKSLSLAEEADRLTLLRRATFDLTGLPPSPEEVQAYLADDAPDAYERLIDRLLASPRYGERWGRYWLDIAGYADSEAKLNYDYLRHHAFRYRDYVIRSFNADKPYDRFLTEQLAGDELVEFEKPKVVTRALIDTLAATAFLKMASDPTDHELYDNVQGRLEVIADEIDVFGSAVLSLTIKCARCHDHKFDPIPQRDYFRLMAVFRGAFDEHDWLKPSKRVLPLATPEDKEVWKAHNEPLQGQANGLRAQIEATAEPLKKKHLERRLADLPEVLRDDLRRMLNTPADKRDAVQRYLAEKFEKTLRIEINTLKDLEPEFKKDAEAIDKQISRIQDRMWLGPGIQAVWDRGEPTPTQVYRRGDFLNRGGFVGPGVPSVLTDGRTPFFSEPARPGTRATGRRLALARWVTRPDHPLTARVLVNRLWRYHYGRGIVETLDNFGQTGSRPSHPELLGWLATEFVQAGWSLKHMHRLMMTATTYRQSSRLQPEHERLDPDNRLISRMPLRRMEAEVLRDTILLAAGKLDEARFGPADPTEPHDDGLVTEPGSERGWRRSIYVRQRRTAIPTILESFDLPQMSPNCTNRLESFVSPQALQLKNDAWVESLAESFARRLRAEAGAEPDAQIERAYVQAVSRPPTDEESRLGRSALEDLTAVWSKAGAKEPEIQALTDFAHALFNSAAFLFID
jgi:mono/diheme cytochrome c family protein